MVGVFVVKISPVTPFSATTSVNVPPVSIPILSAESSVAVGVLLSFTRAAGMPCSCILIARMFFGVPAASPIVPWTPRRGQAVGTARRADANAQRLHLTPPRTER